MVFNHFNEVKALLIWLMDDMVINRWKNMCKLDYFCNAKNIWVSFDKGLGSILYFIAVGECGFFIELVEFSSFVFIDLVHLS